MKFGHKGSNNHHHLPLGPLSSHSGLPHFLENAVSTAAPHGHPERPNHKGEGSGVSPSEGGLEGKTTERLARADSKSSAKQTPKEASSRFPIFP
jgi:hypothetical protein